MLVNKETIVMSYDNIKNEYLFKHKNTTNVAIRSVSAYCTMSYDTVTVVAHIPPIDLLIWECCEVFLIYRGGPMETMAETSNPPKGSRALLTIRFTPKFRRRDASWGH